MSNSLSKQFTFKSLLLFALPTTIMMIVMSFYTIVDGIFVSRYISTNALSSVNIVFPIIMIFIGVAVMLATGSNAIIARQLGEGHDDQARETFSMILVISGIIGIFLAVIGNMFIEPLVRALGASDILLEDSILYLRIQLLSCSALIIQILFQTYFVTEGKPGIGLFLTILAGITNIILDYVFIVLFQMGVTGASLATSIGALIPSVFGLIYFTVSRKTLWLVRFRFSRKDLIQTCCNGSSEMVTNLSTGIITFLCNLLMMKFAGEDGVAAITIIQYSQFFMNALTLGFSQGVSPVISFNYGSKNTRQIHQVYRYSMIFILLASVAVFGAAQLSGGILIEIFSHPGTNVYRLARHGFTIFSFSFLFAGVSTMASALFTAFGDGKTSAVISFVRTLGLIVISLMILPALIGIDGIWMAIPVAEFGAMLLSVFYLYKYKTNYGY